MMFTSSRRKGLLTLAALCLVTGALRLAAAEIPADMANRVSFFAAALSELLGDSRAFTARAELQLPGAAAGEVIPFGMALLDGKMRWQLNLEQVRSSCLPAETLAALKPAHLDRLVMVLESGKPLQLGFPVMKAWLETPMPKSAQIQEQAEAKIGRLSKVQVGQETVDGHPCRKFKLTVPPELSHDEEAFVWTANDLKDLPIRLQVKMQEDVYVLAFRNVQAVRSDPRLFTAPPGFTRYTSLDAVLQAGLLKSLGSGGNDTVTP